MAFVNRQDRHNTWAKEQFQKLAPPLLTCEPVLAETMFLLRRFPLAQDAILRMVEAGVLHVAFSLAQEIRAVRRLVAKYADVPMSLSDACLVRMAELHANHPVCTLDSDFLVYRLHGRKQIPLLHPAA